MRRSQSFCRKSGLEWQYHHRLNLGMSRTVKLVMRFLLQGAVTYTQLKSYLSRYEHEPPFVSGYWYHCAFQLARRTFYPPMRTEEPPPIHRTDYRPPDWLESADLDVSLDATETKMRAKLKT
jgi:hypothetical protein